MTNWSALFLFRSYNTPFFHVSHNDKTSPFLSSWSDSLFLRCVCLFVGESSSSRSYSGWDETAECMAQTAPQMRPTVDQLSADVVHNCCSYVPFLVAEAGPCFPTRTASSLFLLSHVLLTQICAVLLECSVKEFHRRHFCCCCFSHTWSSKSDHIPGGNFQNFAPVYFFCDVQNVKAILTLSH